MKWPRPLCPYCNESMNIRVLWKLYSASCWKCKFWNLGTVQVVRREP